MDRGRLSAPSIVKEIRRKTLNGYTSSLVKHQFDIMYADVKNSFMGVNSHTNKLQNKCLNSNVVEKQLLSSQMSG